MCMFIIIIIIKNNKFNVPEAKSRKDATVLCVLQTYLPSLH